MNSWLENRGINHILGGKYYPQSQGAVECFNKTIQKLLNETYTNSILNENENEWSVPVMIGDFLCYYNNKRIHSTTKMIPRDFLFNYKDKNINDNVIVNTESSRKQFLQEIDFEVGDPVLLTLSIVELSNKRIRSFIRENPMKGNIGKKHEIYKFQ